MAAQPIISDSEYDRLVRELKALEEAFPDLRRPDSPTQRVGGTITKDFPVVPHRRPMLSLDNAYHESELQAFHTKLLRYLQSQLPTLPEPLRYIAQLKIDGVAISLHYEKGLFIRGLTPAMAKRAMTSRRTSVQYAAFPCAYALTIPLCRSAGRSLPRPERLPAPE